jgi:hypothetical protein
MLQDVVEKVSLSTFYHEVWQTFDPFMGPDPSDANSPVQWKQFHYTLYSAFVAQDTQAL